MVTSEQVPTTSRVEARAYCAAMGLLLFAPALICFFRDVLEDADVWWHLKAAEWVLAHGAWPTADGFTSHGAGSPWIAYSWLAELILYGLYRAWGVRGLVLYTAALSVAIVAAFHGLVRRLGTDRRAAVLLTLAAILGLITVQTPRPWLFSILLFVIELDLLLTARRTGNRRLLFWLVPLFALWANMHIQFVLGLAVLGLALIEPLLARCLPREIVGRQPHTVSFAWMLSVFALCVGATLVNPYHYHLYEVAWQLVGQSRLWNLIQELGAMPFRSIENWLVLAVTVGAAFALGCRGRRIPLLLVLLFPLAVYVSFRSQRDVWFVLLVGLAVLACAVPKPTVVKRLATSSWSWGVAGAVALAVVGGSLLLGESRLRQRLAERFPVHATQFIAEEQCSGPMFNPFDWGGYLIFHLPQVPVGIDGRTMVHGEARILRHANTLRGREGWRDDPELSRARLVLLHRRAALTSLLRLDGRFRLIHEDAVAVVFSRNADPDRLEHARLVSITESSDDE
jgi:hypothetical protein